MGFKRVKEFRLLVILLALLAVVFSANTALALEPDPPEPLAAEDPCTWNGKTVEENRPGWWEQEQAGYQAILEAAIADRQEDMTLEEAAQQEWAPRVGVGPDVTALDLPAWMQSIVVPVDCTLVAGQEPTPSEEPIVEGMTAEEIAFQVQLYIEEESSALERWIVENDLLISLEEAAQRWVEAKDGGWETDQVSPWGICAPEFLTPASLEFGGTSIPDWISSRIVGYGSGPNCE